MAVTKFSVGNFRNIGFGPLDNIQQVVSDKIHSQTEPAAKLKNADEMKRSGAEKRHFVGHEGQPGVQP